MTSDATTAGDAEADRSGASGAPAVASSGAPAVASAGGFAAGVADEHLFCPKCGYALRGVAGPRCPECGLELARLSAEAVRIPWESARGLAAIPAYARTALLAVCHGRRLHRAYFQPIRFRAARSFWFVTLTILWLGTLLLLGESAVRANRWCEGLQTWTIVENSSFLGEARPWLGDFLVILGAIAAAVGAAVGLMVGSGVPTYFFHPRRLPIELQNRSLSLAYYAPASLLIILPVIVPVRIAFHLSSRTFRDVELWMAEAVAIGIGLLAYGWHLIALARRTRATWFGAIAGGGCAWMLGVVSGVVTAAFAAASIWYAAVLLEFVVT